MKWNGQRVLWDMHVEKIMLVCNTTRIRGLGDRRPTWASKCSKSSALLSRITENGVTFKPPRVNKCSGFLLLGLLFGWLFWFGVGLVFVCLLLFFTLQGLPISWCINHPLETNSTCWCFAWKSVFMWCIGCSLLRHMYNTMQAACSDLDLAALSAVAGSGYLLRSLQTWSIPWFTVLYHCEKLCSGCGYLQFKSCQPKTSLTPPGAGNIWYSSVRGCACF